jgi:hypothetical protein
MKQGTYVQIIIAAAMLFFSMAAHAKDQKTELTAVEQEMLAGLEESSFEVNVKKVNQDSDQLMDSMFVNRAKGETRPKKTEDADDDMTITVRRIVKR